MVDEERVARLLARVGADVESLRQLAARPPEGVLGDDLAMAAMKYRFVTAIEGCARVAHHLSVSEGWAAPDANAEAFRELGRRGVLGEDVAEALARAAGFRNVLVHQYVEVEDARVVSQLGRLDDLDRFVTDVADWVSRNA